MTEKRTWTVEDRLAAYIRCTDDGCWEWTGARNQYGYGSMRGPNGATVSTHRFVWELHNGPIPAGLQLDHLCRNRACCNPCHLEPVTQQENIRRGRAAAKPTCRLGHLMDIVVGARKERRCSTCERRKRRERTERERQKRQGGSRAA